MYAPSCNHPGVLRLRRCWSLFSSRGLSTRRRRRRRSTSSSSATANPLELVAAQTGRIASRGRRTRRASATPTPPSRRRSRRSGSRNFLKDDGTDISTDLGFRTTDRPSCSAAARRRTGTAGSPTPQRIRDGAERAIWAVRTAGGAPWRVAEGTAPELAPDGSSVLFVKDGRDLPRAGHAVEPDERDGPRREAVHPKRGAAERTALVAGRQEDRVRQHPQDHSFIAVLRRRDAYDQLHGRRASTSTPARCGRPTASTSCSSVVPGLPFGQQAQQGGGGIGIPNGPAFNPNARGAVDAATSGGPGRSPGAQRRPRTQAGGRRFPGLMRATFKGGYTLSVMKADVATGEAEELWHNEPNDRVVATSTIPRLAGNYIVFPHNVGGWRTRWPRRGQQRGAAAAAGTGGRVGSLLLARTSKPGSKPVLLTTTDGLIEDQTSIALSPDGKTFYYCTNANDIDRRHIWAVPVAGGDAAADHGGQGHRDVAGAARVRQAARHAERRLEAPAVDRRLEARGDRATQTAQQCVFPTAAQLKDFPTDLHVEPTAVTTQGRRRHRRSQPAVPAEGPQARREAAGDHLRARRPGAADAARLPLHALLPLGLRHQSVAGQPGLRRAVGELPQRHRLRPFVPQRAEHRRTRQRRVPGRARRRQVPADAARMSIPARIGIWGLSYGGVLTGAGAGAQLRHLQGRRRPRRRAPVGQLARSGVGLVQVLRDRRDRRLEVTGAARARRRRPQRRVPADHRPGAAAARAQRLLRADRVSRTTRTSRCSTAAGSTRWIGWRSSSTSTSAVGERR